MKSKKQTFFYSNELEDEFYKKDYKTKKIDNNYKFVSNNLFYKICSTLLYRFIATPAAFIYLKLIKRIKYVNRKALKTHKKTGYFVYGNHTHALSDALSPSLIGFPKKSYTIASPDNVSIPVLGKVTKMIGAIPLPDGIESSKNFIRALQTRLEQKCSIMVYPEAHIWPYYTSIRPFKSTSFKYPVKYDTPVFCFTTTYQKTKRNKCKVIIYVDGPFYKNNELSAKLQAEHLRDEVYNCMLKRSENSNYYKINYVKLDSEKAKEK